MRAFVHFVDDGEEELVDFGGGPGEFGLEEALFGEERGRGREVSGWVGEVKGEGKVPAETVGVGETPFEGFFGGVDDWVVVSVALD